MYEYNKLYYTLIHEKGVSRERILDLVGTYEYNVMNTEATLVQICQMSAKCVPECSYFIRERLDLE